jgi:hypothetical protein
MMTRSAETKHPTGFRKPDTWQGQLASHEGAAASPMVAAIGENRAFSANS